MVDVDDMFDDEADCARFDYSARDRGWEEPMTAKRNTDVVPVTGEMWDAYYMAYGTKSGASAIPAVEAAINTSPELTALIAENERMRSYIVDLEHDLDMQNQNITRLRGALERLREFGSMDQDEINENIQQGLGY